MRTRMLTGLMLLALVTARPQTSPFPTRKLTLPDSIVDLVWDAAHSRFLAAAGASVHILDPDAAAIEATIAVGETAGRISVSDDGQYLYVAIASRNAVKRYRLAERALDGEISVGQLADGRPRLPAAIAAVPGQSGADFRNQSFSCSLIHARPPNLRP